MNSTKFIHNTNLYGKSYLIQRLLEKPFFLGEKGFKGEPVEGEHVKGKLWKLRSNPIYCEVKDSYSLEDLVILMIYSLYHFRLNGGDSTSLFERLQLINARLIDRIIEEMRPKAMRDVDIIMSAYNLIFLILDFTIAFKTSTLPPVLRYVLGVTINKLMDLGDMLLEDRKLLKRPKAILAVIEMCDSAIYYIINMISEIGHNDLNALYTKILSKLGVEDLNPSVINGYEDQFYMKTARICIVEDYQMDINYVRATPNNRFSAITVRLPDATLDLRKFEDIVKQNSMITNKYSMITKKKSMITNKNLENFKNLMRMMENQENNPPEERKSDLDVVQDSFRKEFLSEEYSEKCQIIRLYPQSKSNLVEYRLILEEFIVRFWERRNERNKDGCILFSSEETEFIFHFVTQVLKSLRILPNRDEDHYTILERYLKDYAIVLNSLRFQEINSLDSIKIAAILSKTAHELVKDKYVYLYFNKPECDDLQMVTTRIVHYLYFQRKQNVVLLEPVQETQHLMLSKCRSIDDVSQIPKIRRSAWKEAFGNCRSAEDCLSVFKERNCPVCKEELKSYDLCVFLCMHTLCSPCTTKLIGNGKKRYFCPVCRSPVCEFIPSLRVARICRDIQQ